MMNPYIAMAIVGLFGFALAAPILIFDWSNERRKPK